MLEVVGAAVRSGTLASIRGKDKRPKMIVCRGLHARGFRYRLHDWRLAGRPDLVFLGRHAVILVFGRFWRGHHCPLFRWLASKGDLGDSESREAAGGIGGTWTASGRSAG